VITLRNTEKKPLTIMLHIDKGDFITLVGQRGAWERAGSPIGAAGLDARAESVSLTVTLQPNEFAELALEAAVKPDALAALLGPDGFAMLTSKMSISWKGEADTASQTRQANLFYLLDAGDGSVTDGLLDLAPVADAAGTAISTRVIRIPIRGDLASDTDLTATLLNTGDYNFFGDASKDGAALVYKFDPLSLGAAGVGPNEVIDTGTLDFNWNGLKIGTADLRGTVVKSQIINLDREGLRAAVNAQLAALTDENTDPDSEEARFAAKFAGLTDQHWAAVTNSIYNTVLTMLGSSGVTDFRISQGDTGSLDLIFKDGVAPWGALDPDGTANTSDGFRRLGLASFDFAPSADGNTAARTLLGKLLDSEENAKLTEAQKRFLLDQLFNQRRFGDRVVLDTAAIFNALKPAASKADFDGIEAFATWTAWAYTHEIAHTLGLPDMYDFDRQTRLPNAGLMGAQGDFVVSAPLADIIRLASDNPQSYEYVDVDRLIAFLAEMRDAGMLERGAGSGRDYAFSPFTGSVPLVGTGWRVLGQVEQIADGLLLTEANTARTAAVRSFVLPADARQLTFTLRTKMAGVSGQVPDAFEVGLLNAVGEAFTVVSGLSNTDAALNLQAGGMLRLANGLTSTLVSTSVDGWQSRQITVDLAAIAASGQLTLSFDLLGFGARDARVEILDLEFDVPPVDNTHLPVALGGGSVTGDEDTAITIDLRDYVNDADGDPVLPVMDRFPEHGTLDEISAGVYRYTPAENFNGEDSFTFAATDGIFTSLPVSFAIRVLPVNDAPVIVSQVMASVAEGQKLSLQLAAVDVDGDPLQFTLSDGPAGAAVNATGLLEWVATQTGRYEFRVTVADGAGGVASQVLQVTVTNLAPTVTLQLPPRAVLGEAVSVKISFADPGGDPGQISVDWGDGTVESLAIGVDQPSHIYADPGTYRIKVTGTDSHGGAAEVAANLPVQTPGLFVSALTAGPWGVNVRFNAPVDIGLPNPYLYTSRPGEPVDILLLDADGRPVNGSLLPDTDNQGFTLITSGDGLRPGTYRLRLTGDNLGWRGKWDLLSNGPQGYFETSFDIAESPAQVFVQEAVQSPGKPLGKDGEGLDLTLEQAGGLRSLVIGLNWDATVLDISGLVSGLPGVTVLREASGSGTARFRIQFATSPQAGRLLLGHIAGTMRPGVAYGALGRPLGVMIMEINGVAQDMAVQTRTGDQAMVLAALAGDANGDRQRDEADAALFAVLQTRQMLGLEAWRNIDPALLSVPKSTGGGGSGGGGSGSGGIIFPTTRVQGSGSGGVASPSSSGIYGPASALINVAFRPGSEAMAYGSGPNRMMYGASVQVCLVPEDKVATAERLSQAKKSGLCFAGQPADLVDEDQLWRLVGITGMPSDADVSLRRERAENGNVCIIVDGDEPFVKGTTFNVARAPLRDTGIASVDEHGQTQHRRLCFEVLDPDIEVKMIDEIPSGPEIAAADTSGDGATLTALAMFATLSAGMPQVKRVGQKRQIKFAALFDETSPEEWSVDD
ncbi:Ig-like domain-containing protein, partial [Pseudorhodobacter sp.]|uniref:Ig-like domain-containing protein n=1 Tax=Pseudorhodobacter sp. TaxID=1934400 RepID=UPI00264857DF